MEKEELAMWKSHSAAGSHKTWSNGPQRRETLVLGLGLSQHRS